MSIIQRIHDRLTGVLGRDCEGKAVRKGDLVEPAPHVPSNDIAPGARCQMTAERLPGASERMTNGASGVLVCINPGGKEILVRRWSAIRKVPRREQEARWESVERVTGWTPRTVEHDEEVPA